MTAPHAASSPAPTTLFVNGRVRSPVGPAATALLSQGPTVVFVGSDSAAASFPADRRVDLAGALVTPAFVDAHVHATATGLALEGLDLAGSPSLAVALDRLERYARQRRGGVVLGTGWDETHWPEHRPPTAAELDRASYGGVVYLARADVHSAVVSSALLAAVPEARTLPGYAADGLVRWEAHHAVRRAAYAVLSPQQRRAAQRATRRHAAGLGIGCLHEMAGPEVSGEDDLAALLVLTAEEPGPEVVGYWGALGDIETPQRMGLTGAGGDLFVDGALGSHTACLREPYADEPATRGQLRFTAEQIGEHVTACTRAGLQAGFHVIGDAAMAEVLAGFALAVDQVGLPAVIAGRHRLEHAEMPVDIDALAGLGIVLSVQPSFDATWGGPDGMYATRLGGQRARGLNPFAGLAAAGVPLAFGSDAPVTPLDPWAGVRAAVHHQTPGAGLSARAAFAAATRGGWRAARLDADGAGTLVPGAPASLAIWSAGELRVQLPDDRVAAWSTDPRAAVAGLPDLGPAAALPTCLATIVRGQVVFHDDGLHVA